MKKIEDYTADELSAKIEGIYNKGRLTNENPRLIEANKTLLEICGLQFKNIPQRMVDLQK